ncbi:Protein of unknown function [Cotesia congregata]|uniref:Collagen type XV/XVIII trimerization domain-containing protein n=2 Tax=Cotesia TaxID=32390 RepID=A0A8J2MLT7_COTCN|nr:Protein of unknown function [Cotesia congregata]
MEKQKQQEKEAKQNAILQRKELRLQIKKQKEEEREAKKRERELKKRIPEDKEDESNDLEKTSAIHNIETDKRGRGRPRGIGAIRNIYESTTKIVPGAVTFQNTEAMIKMSTISPVGTLAYIIDEEALLVRVNNGWQYIALGTLLSTSTRATVTPALSNPPFEASNLINQLPIRTDGSGVSIIFYSFYYWSISN